MISQTKLALAGATALTLFFGGAASAAHLSYYAAALAPLNSSGITGNVFLTFDGPEDDGERSLLVQVMARNLEPGPHAAHIHGFTGENGMVQDSVAPVPGVFNVNQNGDGDGFIELSEGAPFYGGILLTFEGLEADANGMVNYTRRFAVEAGSQLDDDLYSLDNREVVLHGITTNFAVGAVPPFPGGEVDTDTFAPGTYNALLPVATGEFVAVDAEDIPPVVPLPAGIWLMGAGLGALGLARTRRRHKG